MAEAEEKPTSEKPQKKKNFFLRHVWDFGLLALLAAGTSSFYIVRAVQSSQTTTQDLKATVLLEGKTMNIPDANGKNRNPFSLSLINEYEEIEIQGKHTYLVLGLKHNAIAVVRSGCPGQECVREGYVTGPNHPIVCAHNGIFIEVTADDWGEVIIG